MPDPNAKPEPPNATDAAGTFAYIGHEPAPARLRVVRHGAAARAARALRVLALCWGLAIAAVFLPLLHFVLVPGLLLLGPILALGRRRERCTVLSARGACPACGAEIHVLVGQGAAAAMPMRCESCRRAIELRPDEGLLRD